MKILRIFFYSCIILICSCSSSKNIHYYGTNTEKIEKIALISTIIGKIDQPTLPLIDAAEFNYKTNDIADKINQLQIQKVDEYRSLLASSIKKYFKCSVIYGDSLHYAQEFGILKEKYDFPEALKINNKNFPKLICGSNDINPFQFENGKVTEFFKDPVNYQNPISVICKTLGADIIIVSFSRLLVYGTSAFGKMRKP